MQPDRVTETYAPDYICFDFGQAVHYAKNCPGVRQRHNGPTPGGSQQGNGSVQAQDMGALTR